MTDFHPSDFLHFLIQFICNTLPCQCNFSVEAGRLLPWQDYVLFKPKWQEQQSIKSNLTITNSSSTVGQSVRLNAAPSHDDVSTGESEIPEEACESAKDGPRNSEAPSSSRTHANPKAGDPKFLEEFYSNSRLHHISSWGAEFKAYVNQLQSQSNPNFPGRQRLAGMVREEASEEALDESFKKSSQCIMHIDMDCFFVSVGLINRPHLRGEELVSFKHTDFYHFCVCVFTPTCLHFK